jgi:hypothetical protein
MQPTILYNPNNGITMPYDPALAGMAPNLVALTDAEYEKIVRGKTVAATRKETAVPELAKPSSKDSSNASAAPYTIDTVPDGELLAFCKERGLDFGDLFEVATTEEERAEALKAIRKRAAKDIARLAAAARKAK